jgi:type II secretory pathway pseudopilin PulG
MLRSFKFPRSANTPAFTLVEVVLGMTILSVVMMAITSLAVVSMRANRSNIHRLTAYYLAQESLEGLRNVRDSNWLQNYTWNEGASAVGGAAYWGDAFDGDGYYLIDYVPWTTSAEENSAPWTLTYLGSDASALDEDTGTLYLATSSSEFVFYLHDNTQTTQYTYEDSGYRRTLALSYSATGEDWVEVTATVYWVDYGEERSVEVSTVLSDWREGPI